MSLVKKIKDQNHNLIDRKIVKDDKKEIKNVLLNWSKIKEVDVIKEATDIFSTLAEPRPYEKGISKYIEPPRS